MRYFLSLVSMFLLTLTLHAQDCKITDLTASFVPEDPASCKYTVILKFTHTGPGVKFTVQGNGTNYGTFLYTDVPVKIGPIMGQTNAPLVREFLVKDTENPDCKAVISLTLPPCPAVACAIRDLTAEAGKCNADGKSYPLKLNFKVENPGSELFEVYTVTGQKLGEYKLSQLPLEIPNYPAGNSTATAVKVCIKNSPNCCAIKQFIAPNCTAPACKLDLLFSTGDCTTDSTYSVKFTLAPNSVTVGDSFALFFNGVLYKKYPWSALPLGITDIKWNGKAFNTMRLCAITPPGVPQCCVEEEYLVPKCFKYPDCEMSAIRLEPGACTSDNSFKLTVNFKVADPTKVDSFQVWADGKPLGKYAISQLPLTLDYPWSKPNIFSVIKICAGNDAKCCAERQFPVPDCLKFGGCEIYDISVKTGDCRANGTYPVSLNFKATNPGNYTFTVWGNGTQLGTWPLGALPLIIPNVPGNGAATDVIKICINQPSNSSVLCCAAKEFQGPTCSNDPCKITDLSVQTGDCIDAQTYKVTIKFGSSAPADTKFGVWANGVQVGTYKVSDLPLSLNVKTDGGPNDVIKVCLFSAAGAVLCCESKEYPVPACITKECKITDLAVSTGDCSSDSTYAIKVNFKVSGNTSPLFGIWVNGKFYGNYPIAALPLTLPKVLTDGGANDVVKVCMLATNQPSACCATIEYKVPDCLNNPSCEIYDLKVEAGDCTSDSTYKISVNFKVASPLGTKFGVWAGNGKLLGTYELSQLPISILNFPASGAAVDKIKVCMFTPNGDPGCCRVAEFKAPNCIKPGECSIYDMTATAGDCTGDKTYKLKLNFKVKNNLTQQFTVSINGQFVGFYNLSQLPLTLDAKWDGGTTDIVEVCLVGTNQQKCCTKVEYKVPDCVKGNCEIYDLLVTTGECTSDSTYRIKISFKVANNKTEKFQLWGNGKLIGTYELSQLPLTIDKFKWDGGNVDFIKVCMVSTDPATTPCCREKEFAVPACLKKDCIISDLEAAVGDCTGEKTYKVKINFKVSNNINEVFEVYANGQKLGIFKLSQLPLTIENFPASGNAVDVIKVCMVPNNSGGTQCCKAIEVKAPKCDEQCTFDDLEVSVGECTSDKTYKIKFNFKVSNNNVEVFTVFGNGINLGTYKLSQLPLTIEKFPWNGSNVDVLKICIPGNLIGGFECCTSFEVKAPECIKEKCDIFDLKVQQTPCLCGKFFALLTFGHEGNPNGKFEVIGVNNKNYGSFSYNQAQPVIIGPLEGDGTTDYKFLVRDLSNSNCAEDVKLGKVDCPEQAVAPIEVGERVKNTVGYLNISPNPADNFLNVSTILNGVGSVGQVQAEIRNTDGRLLNSQTIGNGSNFALDVSQLPAGVYRLSVISEQGRLDASFVKQ